MRLVSALAVIATLAATPTLAGDILDDAAGYGTISCDPFLVLLTAKDQTVQAQAQLDAVNWAEGFMSAANLSLGYAGQPKKNLKARVFESQVAYLHTYCNLHRHHYVIDAVSALFKDLPEVPKKAGQ